MKRKLMSLVLAASIALGGVAATAAPAMADQGTLPSGCSLSATAPVASSTKIKYSGQGYCTAPAIYKLHVELWHWWSWLPAVDVHESMDWSGPSWAAGASVCDNGGTADYFTKAAYYRNSGGDIIRESAVRSVTHC
ncbi:hypothetical protein [Microbacterium sp. JZ101]